MRRIATLGLLFAGYLVAAKLGLAFASVHPSASPIWPPTGIALAAMLLLGRDVWPAIFAGAFVANVTTEGSIATSLAIAAGNALEGVAGSYLVERYARGARALDSPPDIFRFAALAGLLSTMLSPTLGVTALSLGGFAAWDAYATIWVTWWLGDAAGALLVTPVCLVWNSPAPFRWDQARRLEGVLLLLALVATGIVAFGGVSESMRNAPLSFLCIPPLVWTAFRFRQRETAIAILVLTTIAMWGTLREVGPFAVEGPIEGVLLLQAFMGTMSVMAMTVAALVAEHRRILAAELGARTDAEAASLAKDTFLAMLGHELRNPLAAVTTAVHVLDRVVPLEGKASHVHGIIATQVAQLARIVDDLLDLTRVTTGKIVLQRARLDLNQFVARLLDTLDATGVTGRHEVRFDGKSAWIDVDATRLEQVVNNLVTNALKYTPPGGRIDVTVSAEYGQAILRVADTGMGIAPEMLPRIFDVFTQGDPGIDRSKGGLGIGLTLVKRLTELHGGAVEAASGGAGRGSVFIVRFPSVPPAEPADPVVRVPRAARRRRVLLVEDQTDAREMLRFALELAGHDVFEAADGLDAIEKASNSGPEVAIIDIGLPGCDGYEVARQIRRLPEGQAIFLVALTGYGQPQDRLRAEQAGFDLHLVKPIDPDRINALLAERSRVTSLAGRRPDSI
jgi:signal transduction histidine kinase/ActR/RegA family two-component response regulator